MKKFITYVSMQPQGNLEKIHYEPGDELEIRTDHDVCFPVSILVDNYAKEDDSVEVICLKEIDNPDVERNFQCLKEEVSELLGGRNVDCRYYELYISPEEKIDTHLATFAHLIEHIDDEDEIYACATYGTKPIPIIELMALDYAYRVKKNVTIGNIVYGKVDRRNEKKAAKLYDITALFFMSQIVGHLAEQNVPDPKAQICRFLGLEDEE